MMEFSNMILVGGAGRNVGKTSFICDLIRHFSAAYDLVGIKISPHTHQRSHENEMIRRSDDFIIWVEANAKTGKDSSRMLKAGAHKVYYVEVTDRHTSEALQMIMPEIESYPVICESAALRRFIIPGIFIFIDNMQASANTKNMDQKEKADFILHPSENSFNFNYGNIFFNGKKWIRLKKEG
jgi:hypothetical protein